MRKLFSWCGVVLVSLTIAMTSTYAEAAKFGGNRSFGKSFRTAPAPKQAQPAMNKPQQPATANPAMNKKGLLGGMLGGLLAGGLLAALIGGGAFQGLQIMDMLIMAGVAFVLFRLFRSMMQKKAATMQPQGASPFGQAPQGHQGNPFAAFESTPSQPGQVGTGIGTQGGFGSQGTQPGNDVPFNLPPDFDLQAFLNGSREHFRTLQDAWNKNDLEKIQEYVSPELYNGLVEERRNYTGEQHTEVMFVDAELVRADHNGRTAEISLRFTGRYRDTHEQVEQAIDEVWHLERQLTTPNAPWFIVGIEQ